MALDSKILKSFQSQLFGLSFVGQCNYPQVRLQEIVRSQEIVYFIGKCVLAWVDFFTSNQQKSFEVSILCARVIDLEKRSQLHAGYSIQHIPKYTDLFSRQMAAEMVQFYCQNASCGNFDLYLHYCNILLYLNCRAVADPGEGAGGPSPPYFQTKLRKYHLVSHGLFVNNSILKQLLIYMNLIWQLRGCM